MLFNELIVILVLLHSLKHHHSRRGSQNNFKLVFYIFVTVSIMSTYVYKLENAPIETEEFIKTIYNKYFDKMDELSFYESIITFEGYVVNRDFSETLSIVFTIYNLNDESLKEYFEIDEFPSYDEIIELYREARDSLTQIFGDWKYLQIELIL